jgi:predicted CoA-binding protein
VKNVIYSDKFLKNILKDTKSIAVVGASAKPYRDSYKVIAALIKHGYMVYPVNPNEVGNKILGLECFPDLNSIKKEIDMVDIFRSKDAVLEITNESINIGAKIIWMQLDIIHMEAAELAKKNGLKVVMNRCPKIELEKPYWTSK